MFTGIVEELGSVRARDGGKFEFNAKTVVEDAGLGDS
nr:riboflavin synthase [Actinomycetota bacterium]